MKALKEIFLISLAIITVYGQPTTGLAKKNIQETSSGSLAAALSKLRPNYEPRQDSKDVSIAKIKQLARNKEKSGHKDTSSRFSTNIGGSVKLHPGATFGQNRYKFQGLGPRPYSHPTRTHNVAYQPTSSTYPLASQGSYPPPNQYPIANQYPSTNPNPGTTYPAPNQYPLPNPYPGTTYPAPNQYPPHPGTTYPSHIQYTSRPRPHKHLSNYDYKHIWLQMLQEIYKVMKDKHLIDDIQFISYIFDKLFNLLRDIDVLDDHFVHDSLTCPKKYTKSGRLCLLADKLEEFLAYDEARLYCQVVHGGDLAIFRDANEFHDIQKFINQAYVTNHFSYWIGLSDAKYENDWRFIDGSAVHYGAPFWGTWPYGECDPDSHLCNTRVKIVKRESDSDDPKYPDPHNIHPGYNDVDADPSDENDYGVLNKHGYHYIYPASNSAAEGWDTVPLCQFIPERDQKNFQYGEGIYEEWVSHNEYKGWYDGDDAYGSQYIDIKAPHRHDHRNVHY